MSAKLTNDNVVRLRFKWDVLYKIVYQYLPAGDAPRYGTYAYSTFDAAVS